MPRAEQGALHEAYIGIGSNIGHRIHHLAAAVEALTTLAGGRLRASPVYETRPVDYEAQPDFLNMVVRLETSLSPLALLDQLQRVEAENGRERTVRFGPRTLDLDLLLYDDDYVCFRQLTIPHPRMWQRAFVMVPLADLAPNRLGPGGWTVRQWAAHTARGGGVRYVGRFW